MPLQEVVIFVQDEEQEVSYVEKPVLKLKDFWIPINRALMVIFYCRPHNDRGQIEYVDWDEE